jgi:hypothetical protein
MPVLVLRRRGLARALRRRGERLRHPTISISAREDQGDPRESPVTGQVRRPPREPSDGGGLRPAGGKDRDDGDGEEASLKLQFGFLI